MPHKKRPARRLNPRAVLRLFDSQRHLATQLGVTQQAISKWLKKWDTERRGVPDEWHIKLAHLRPEKLGYLLQQ